jgi:hypothetical protein
MKKLGFGLFIVLFLLAYVYAFAQEAPAPPALDIPGGEMAATESMAAGGATAPDRGLIKGKV